MNPAISFRARSKLRLLGLAIVASLLCVGHGQDTTGLSRDTAERMNGPGWWPTKGTAARSEYAGSTACASCHANIAELQKLTPMFKAASRPEATAILRQHGDLQFMEGDYSYALARHGVNTTFSVTDKSRTLSAPVALAIGNGEEVGQTYLLKQNDTYFESRLSYFSGLRGLGITPGQSTNPPAALEQSLGEPLDLPAVTRCFGCHTTASTISGTFDPEHATPGVGCEACHGPGSAHIKSVGQGAAGQGVAEHGVPGNGNFSAAPLNPQKLSPVDSVDFCGACHRTPVDVAVHMSPQLGLISIRFQPYRLERSFCWGTDGDPRITCIACHDPHKPLVRETASYDPKCLACHANAGHPAAADQAPACTVATKDCASCHMPRYEVRVAHATFTDHFIRIVRPGSGFRE